MGTILVKSKIARGQAWTGRLFKVYYIFTFKWRLGLFLLDYTYNKDDLQDDLEVKSDRPGQDDYILTIFPLLIDELGGYYNCIWFTIVKAWRTNCWAGQAGRPGQDDYSEREWRYFRFKGRFGKIKTTFRTNWLRRASWQAWTGRLFRACLTIFPLQETIL